MVSAGKPIAADRSLSMLLISSQLSPVVRSLPISPELPHNIVPVAAKLWLVVPGKQAGTFDITHLSSLKNVRTALLQ